MHKVTSNQLLVLYIFLLSSFVTALPTLHLRQVEAPQPCGYNSASHYGTFQTSQPECTAAATQLCGWIPFSNWTVDGWTNVDSGSCRAMVYHDNNMPVPTQDECMQTFGGIISACIIEQGTNPDYGNANANLNALRNDPHMAEDPAKTIYQIGAGAYYDKNEQMNNAYVGAASGSGMSSVIVHMRRWIQQAREILI